MKQVVIIGGGLGGLTASIYLANAGYTVTILEQNSDLGGKLHQAESDGFHFDLGPSTITLKSVFEQVFTDHGKRLEDYAAFYPIHPIAANFFSDGSIVRVSSEIDAMQEQISAYSKADARNYPHFMKESRRLYQLSEQAFLHQKLFLPKEKMRPGLLKDFLSIRPLQSMQHLLKQYFKHPNTLQMIGRYATYVGSSPYQAPGVFAMMAYLESGKGVYGIKGGTYQLIEAFKKLALESGVSIRTNTKVTAIQTKNRSVVGVSANKGDFKADIIIGNGDALSLYGTLLPKKQRPHFSDKKLKSIEPSASGLTLLLGVNKRYPQLLHHNVFFPQAYENEFNDIFQKKIFPEDPAVYICFSGANDPSTAPEGKSNLFILVNGPAIAPANITMDVNRYQEKIVRKLENRGLHDLSDAITYRQVQTPRDLAVRTNAFRGSIYGMSSNSFRQAFFRVPNKDAHIKGLWFTGGSTHPGGGTPMVTLSGQLTAEAIINSHSII